VPGDVFVSTLERHCLPIQAGSSFANHCLIELYISNTSLVAVFKDYENELASRQKLEPSFPLTQSFFYQRIHDVCAGRKKRQFQAMAKVTSRLA